MVIRQTITFSLSLHGKVVLTDGGWPYRLFLSCGMDGDFRYGIYGDRHLTSQNSSDEEIEAVIQRYFDLGLTLAFVDEWNKNTICMSDICS